MIMNNNCLFNFANVCVTKLLTSSVLFSTAVSAEFVNKPVILGILLSISVILALSSVFLTIPLVWRIFLSASLFFF